MMKNVSIFVLMIFSILVISSLSVIAANDLEREDEVNDVLDEELKEVSRPNIDIYKISCEKDGDEVEVILQLVSNGKIQNSEFLVYTIVLETDSNEYSIAYNNNECLVEDAEINEIDVKSCSGVGSDTLRVVFELAKSSEELIELSAYTMEFSLTAYYVDIYPNEDLDFMEVDANGPYTGYVDESIDFFGTAEGDSSAYEWYWDFGDGESSEERNPSHIYTEPATYEVSLIVSDPETGRAGYDNTTVTISANGGFNGGNHQSNGDNDDSGSGLTIFIALIIIIVIIGIVVLFYVIRR
jgi:hypothetical protein